MEKERLIFLRTFGMGLAAVAATVALPEISSLNPFNSSILDGFNFSGDSADEIAPVDRTLDRLLRGENVGDPFTAEAASDGILVEPMALYPSVPALLNIYSSLGIPASFSNRVCYSEAAQCRRNFEQYEAFWRQYFTSYTDVKRAPVDRDVAYSMAGNIDLGNRLYEAQGATQYQNYRSVSLTDNDPGLVMAATALLNQTYTPTAKENAQSFAVMNREPFVLDDGTTGMRYETPVQSFIHDPRRHRYDRRTGRQLNRGVLIAHHKIDRQNPNNVYFAGLYV